MPPYIISSFFTVFIFILTTHNLLTRKKSITFCTITFILNTLFIFITGIYVAEYVPNEETIKVILYLLSFSYIIYLALVFEESLSKKIFTLFSVWMFSTIALFIAIPFAELATGSHTPTYTQNLIYLFRGGINCLFLFIVYLGMGKYYKTILNLVSDQTIRYMSLYPVMAFLLLITNFTTPTYVAHLRNFNSILDIILFILFVIVGYVILFVGISSASQIVSMEYHMECLDFISKTDSLTGLYNRRFITEQLEHTLESYHITEKHFSLILADIDYFKSINDSFGHDCGDHVLKIVAQNLQDAVGERGYVSRWGGEEFLILLPETELEDAHILADQMRHLSEQERITYNEIEIALTLTFGVTVNKSYEMINDTIKKADNALYKGKADGRNCVVLS